MGIVARIKAAKERLMGEPCFYAILSLWIAQLVRNWRKFYLSHDWSGLFTFVPTNPSSEGNTLVVTDDKLPLVLAGALLVAGVASKALCVFLKRHEGSSACPGTRYSSDCNGPGAVWGSLADSRVPSLLVGWGLGY